MGGHRSPSEKLFRRESGCIPFAARCAGRGVEMAKVYLSSTFKDLQGHREAVYKQLHRMQHGVTAMEDYVAPDDRPADVCTRDVAASDLYVGLFAWRYGHVPEGGNPD